MPQITNTTNADIWLPQLGVTVPANSFINSDVYPVDDANSGVTTSTTWIPSGLQVNSNIQAMDPILLSQKITADTTVQFSAIILPRTSYRVKIMCTAGAVGVRFNSTLNTLLSVPATDTFEIVCQSRTIDTIYFYVTTDGFTSGTVYLTVRKA